MNNTILITRPNHDFPTTYLYYWSELVIDEAKSKGITVLDLDGKKASKQKFSSYISRNNPRLIFLNGHGAKDRVAGYNDEILLDEANCEALLREKIIYARSCEAGAKLGPFSIEKGATVFIGYNKDFWLIRSKERGTKPLTDPIAKFFLEPSNLVPISLIKGNSAQEAYQKSQDDMRRNFSYMISSKASQEERDAAFFLFSNYTCQIILGDKQAKI
ncbi:hypothetical protein HYU96_04590 [Candidatus Daviesbacteria bacterium]|nr:hypothetical protein [Candidatus Daviesbacteria bacterium]